MDPLFSHAFQPSTPDQLGDAPPSRVYRLAVSAPREIAYSAFVGDIHLWWPHDYTGFGETTHVFIEDGIIGEESESGETQVWGQVVAEDQPSFIEFSWTLAWRADAPTRLRVEFDQGETDGETIVTLRHDGWIEGTEGQAQYEKYSDWTVILGRYAAFFGRSQDAVEAVE